MDFWVAIPDSALSDEQTRRDKSIKIAQFARAFSIFRISRVYVYRDSARHYSNDRNLLKLILEFLDTPSYLRKRLYPKRDELRFAGLLHPLKAPHHKGKVDLTKIRVGDIRQAAAVNVKGRYFADAGLDSLIPLESYTPPAPRITVQFISEHPTLRCKLITREDVNDYWGYEVRLVQSLVDLLKNTPIVSVLTSREGEPLRKFEEELKVDLKKTSNVLAVFGSPTRGLTEILRDEGRHPKEFTKYFLNFFPKQATETVRLEEAIMGCLALLNYLEHK
ncbi:MAG: putative RNA uridine N3 methyltransferase [Nitrososphaerales archaeon]